MSTSKTKTKKSVKSTKSVKSCTATKVAKKTVKPKAKTKSTKSKSVPKKALGLVPPPIKATIITQDGYTEFPDIADEYEHSNDGFDSMGNDYGITKYYYVVNHNTGKKFVISGYELSFSFAKIIGEEMTNSNDKNDVYIIKIGSPIAWLITKVFKVETIDANNLLDEAIDTL